MVKNILHIGLLVLGALISLHVCDENMDLARQWAPNVKLAVNEQWKPSSVDFFLRQVNLKGGRNHNLLTPSNLSSCNENCYLDTKMKLSCGSCTEPIVLKGQSSSVAPAYAMMHKHSGNITDIAYWFFYPYNRGKRICLGYFAKNKCVCPKLWGHCTCPRINGCIGRYSTFGHHVGDWEHIIVRLKNLKPYSLFLAVHDKKITKTFGGEYLWNENMREFQKGNKALEWDGTHPIVYSAAGSHGTWPDVGRHVYKNLPNGDTLHDDTSNGESWRTWNNLKVVEYRPNGGYTGEFNFLNFKGRWGNRERGCFLVKKVSGVCRLNNGPVGPQEKR